jgi:hypothetical protein
LRDSVIFNSVITPGTEGHLEVAAASVRRVNQMRTQNNPITRLTENFHTGPSSAGRRSFTVSETNNPNPGNWALRPWQRYFAGGRHTRPYEECGLEYTAIAAELCFD